MAYFVSLLWLIFTIVFLYLAWTHDKESTKKLDSLEKFDVKKEGGTRVDNFTIGEVLYALRDELNQSNQTSHRIAAKSYLIAGLTALVSFVISVVQG